MKTVAFPIEDLTFSMVDAGHGFQRSLAQTRIPVLPAYAVSSYYLQGLDMAEGLPPTYTLEGDQVSIHGWDEVYWLRGQKNLALVINTIGIKDYQAFFSSIHDEGLRDRAACFLEEADKAFDSGAWISFVMMAGAVIEALLTGYVKKPKLSFNRLINRSEVAEVFDGEQLAELHGIRELRNRVHPEIEGSGKVSREEAMETRLILDTCLRRDWQKKESVDEV